MTTIDASALFPGRATGDDPAQEPAAAAPGQAGPSYLTDGTTVWSWIATTDHKRIGVMYFVTTVFALAMGGAFALLLRAEHLTPTRTIVDAYTYNRLFTMHGIVMVWLFMIPSIPAAFGNFLLPMMLGAKDVAFPRLNLLSYYIYLVGSIWVLVALWMGGCDTGWTFYTPYSAHSPSAVVPTVFGIFIVGWSTILTGMNFIVTTHTMRARGLGWFRMPLFVWAMYGTSIIQVLATPVLAISLAIVGVDHALDWGLFDPARGGDPVLYQHLFWFYSHPAVYIMILPAMGVISEVVPTFCHHNISSYKAIAYSTLGIAFVGFGTWGHHMFVAGISAFDAGAFGVLSMLVAIFSAIKVFTWVFTMRAGSIVLRTPLVYFFAFLFLFVFGGMTGVAVATQSLDVHWHDTYFVVAHFHFIMVGGTLTAWLAAIHYWFPKVTGKMYSERWATLGAVLVFGGFFLTFFPQFLLGNAGMPRRYYDYDPVYQPLHVASTIGAFILGAAMLLVCIVLVVAIFTGERASANPWDSRSYEWYAPSPPPKHNFDREPAFGRGPYDYAEPFAGAAEFEASPEAKAGTS
ncbi:MAG TPA: cbb3-type cytochrome c oxidase subunit I [Polyangiaceae bacterium]|jgi:cytochrome c oxidase subunit 1|nr:cbb3-type cytochrome c oxidase subunit I [Polyangiaceae bacterium]